MCAATGFDLSYTDTTCTTTPHGCADSGDCGGGMSVAECAEQIRLWDREYANIYHNQAVGSPAWYRGAA